MRIRSDSAKLKVIYKKIGDCVSNTYEFDNTGSIAPNSKPFKSNSFNIYFGDGSAVQQMGYGTKTHPYPAPGFYKGWMALVDTNYCNTPDTVFFQFEIIANVKAKFTPPPKGCLSAPMQFTNESLGGESFLWIFGDNSSSTDKNPKHLFGGSGLYTVTLYAFNLSSCNKVDSISFQIEVSISPKADFVFTPNPPKINTPVNFINQSTGAINYIWTFGDGDTIVTSNKNLPIKHLYQLTKTFNACLKVFNLYNCTDTICKPVNARVSQLYDVPSAFSPNGDGKNDRIYVRGYGIKTIKWEIYNRWGILMFASNNLSDGWDGTYKGAPMPQDAYAWKIKARFRNGKIWEGMNYDQSQQGQPAHSFGTITLFR
jgi:gliding motility-associated-like protein